jgi:sulfur transfer complex TusBCD TusB component (DsrH family)
MEYNDIYPPFDVVLFERVILVEDEVILPVLYSCTVTGINPAAAPNVYAVEVNVFAEGVTNKFERRV